MLIGTSKWLILRGFIVAREGNGPFDGRIKGVEVGIGVGGTIIEVTGLAMGHSDVVAGTDVTCALKVYRLTAPVVTH